MNLEWLKLRPFNGDIKYGFEELVCQLARAENIKDKKQFLRVAAPDGGVEAYCILTNGDEYGWQAKFFSSMGDSQWSQLDKSFKTAIDKHPNLKKYFICTPLDRQDPRIITNKGTVVKHFMDVWNEQVTEWETFAKSEGREIEFVYWGNSELFELLSKPGNEGKLHYWFGQDEFSDNWFELKLEESILNLGKRYTPELNLDLPIAKTFEGLSRDSFFEEQFRVYLHDLLMNCSRAISHVKSEKVKELVQKIEAQINEVQRLYNLIDFREISTIDIKSFSDILVPCSEVINELIHQFYDLDAEIKKEKESKKEYVSEANYFGWDIEYFRKLENSADNLNTFLHSSTVSLSNNPFLILIGEAGIGKSHLLADIAKKRETRSQFTLLLLGQQFSTTEDPWTQISKLLQIESKRDVFLGALNSKAESSGARILIFIDAINEGEGKAIWKNHLSSFIAAVKRFQNIGVVFSLRTSYEKLLIPEEIIEQKQARKMIHYGFANHEYEASKRFFENYKIKQPSIPLLHPEFSNPLFLKLFCEGLYKKGLSEIPDGYEGISAILNFFLESINDKLSEKHNLPNVLGTVQKVIKKIASKIVDTSNSYLKYEDAFSLVTEMKETGAVVNKAEFFHDLIREGLLTENLFWDRTGNHFEGIYISYERFGDHLIATYLLENFLDPKNPLKSFRDESKFTKAIKYFAKRFGFQFPKRKLYELVSDENEANRNRGIIEAISIQLPEQTNIELYEAAIQAREFQPVVVAFVESIIWRKKETLSERQKQYINEVIIGQFDYLDYFINTILLITSHPQNYFNSDFLHNYLWRFTMADRDSWWTQFIHGMYPGYSDEVTVIRRMIDWSWTDDKRETITDESIRLMSQTMIWFLSSCNRTLRDSATKAIICLLEERINVLMQLIKTFEKVNDPYILQRVYGIAYGCAVRTSNTKMLKPLADLIFNTVFNIESVIPDILLRDYAKGIIEVAISKGHSFEFDINRIQPPFKSVLPTTFPTNEETDLLEFDYQSKDFKDYYWSQNSILSSMVTEYGRGMSHYGDFGRYVFQSGLSHWRVNANSLSNLAVKWIIEKYGYDVEKHGEFDRTIGSGRHRNNNGREERIGKKYQWIAFYEILARVSDNYPFFENSYDPNAKKIKYEGPWVPYVRDIDPTITIKKTLKDNPLNNWWNPISYSNWGIPNKDWISTTNDLPNLMDLIKVTDDQGSEWLILEMYPDWVEPTPLGEERYKSPHKRLFYDLSSHIIHKSDWRKITEYLKGRNLRGCGLSESTRRYQMFSREYYWAAANRTFRSEYYNGKEWEELYNRKSGEFICETARTAIQFLWEEEFDASKEETISFYKPTEFIFNLLKLNYSKGEGQLLNNNGEVICFDPSVFTPSPSCLVIKKVDLIEMLVKNDLEIIWTSIGEKQIVGGNFNREEWVGRLNISDIVFFEAEELKSASHYEKE